MGVYTNIREKEISQPENTDPLRRRSNGRKEVTGKKMPLDGVLSLCSGSHWGSAKAGPVGGPPTMKSNGNLEG